VEYDVQEYSGGGVGCALNGGAGGGGLGSQARHGWRGARPRESVVCAGLCGVRCLRERIGAMEELGGAVVVWRIAG